MADTIGPTSRMPGSAHTLPEGATCDRHPDRAAVARIQGETDSMGAELNDMCQQCLDEDREFLRTFDTSGACEWCGNFSPKRSNRRDYDEGMAGRIYLVCRPCIDREEEEALRELEEHDYD